MIRISGEITYTDGRTQEYVATQREFAQWERWALRHALPTGTDRPGAGAPLTMTRYLAYCAVMREASADPIGFETWDLDVAEVSAIGDQEETHPTRAARSTDS